MSRKTALIVVLYLVGFGLAVWWWFYLVDWTVKPRTYRIGILYGAVVVFASVFHLRALIRFSRIANHIQDEERAGVAPPGSTTFAMNQRFRYIMRTTESLFVLAIAVLTILGVPFPRLIADVNYGRLVITYFIGSVALTGYLTMRDLWVLDSAKRSLGNDDVFLTRHPNDADDAKQRSA